MPKIPSCWHQIYHHDIIIFSSVCSCSMPPSSLYIFIPPALHHATTAAPDLLAGIRICLLSSIKANAMESSDTTTPFSYSPASSPTSSSPPPQPPAAIHSPCAACKILRRRCADKCVLAPYFPPTEPLKFTTAHRVFGASNIIKLLQDLPESQRADAVSSMVYEANARIRDPVYGCAGAICQLQKQVNELQAQLARAQAELINLQAQNKNLLTLICMEMAQMQRSDCSLHQDQGAEHGLFFQNDAYFLDDIAQGCLFDESLWI